jgi:hypothetical protein
MELNTNSAFTLGPRKTTENIDRVGRSQDISGCKLTSSQQSGVKHANSDIFFYSAVCEAIGTEATPGLLCQPRLIVKMIVEKQVECRLAGETEVLGENLPQRHFCPSQNPT